MYAKKLHLVAILLLLYIYCIKGSELSNRTEISINGTDEPGPPRLSGVSEVRDVVTNVRRYSNVEQSWEVYSYPKANVTLGYQRYKGGIIKREPRTFGLTFNQTPTTNWTSSLILKIRNVTETHFGKYKITLKNNNGRLQLSFLLTPSGPPLPPRLLSINCSSSNAQLFWQPGPFDWSNYSYNIYFRRRPKIIWTKLHTKKSGSKKENPEKLSSRFRNLKRGSYEFKISVIAPGEKEVDSLQKATCKFSGQPCHNVSLAVVVFMMFLPYIIGISG